MVERKIVVIQGPTASGKTQAGIHLAKHLGSEIISADSRQFYREMNIGTAKPSSEQLSEVKHHFINTLSIHDRYAVSDYEQEALAVSEQLFAQKMTPVVTGGSGLFIDAFLYGLHTLPESDPILRAELNANLEQDGGLMQLQERLKLLDPETYQKIDIKNPRRVLRALEVCLISGLPYSHFILKKLPERPFSTVRIGLQMPIPLLYQRINDRCAKMMESGLLQEVKELYPYRNLPALQTIGYSEFFNFLEHKISLEEVFELFCRHSRNFAKRQMTWLRRNKDIFWIPFDSDIKREMVTLLETK